MVNTIYEIIAILSAVKSKLIVAPDGVLNLDVNSTNDNDPTLDGFVIIILPDCPIFEVSMLTSITFTPLTAFILKLSFNVKF